MKRRDLVYLLLAITIFLVAGYIAYTQLMPGSMGQQNKGVVVERVGVIPASLESNGLTVLKDSSRVQDYNSTLDLQGLGNTSPFGQ